MYATSDERQCGKRAVRRRIAIVALVGLGAGLVSMVTAHTEEPGGRMSLQPFVLRVVAPDPDSPSFTERHVPSGVFNAIAERALPLDTF